MSNMTASSSGRKRGRSPELESDECLPISKRINKLRIQSSTQSAEDGEEQTLLRGDGCGSSQTSPEDSMLPWQPNSLGAQQLLNTNNSQQASAQLGLQHSAQCSREACIHSPSCSCNNNCSKSCDRNAGVGGSGYYGTVAEDLNGYDPEIPESENPFYYQINGVLYDAFVERTMRTGFMKHS